MRGLCFPSYGGYRSGGKGGYVMSPRRDKQGAPGPRGLPGAFPCECRVSAGMSVKCQRCDAQSIPSALEPSLTCQPLGKPFPKLSQSVRPAVELAVCNKGCHCAD